MLGAGPGPRPSPGSKATPRGRSPPACTSLKTLCCARTIPPLPGRPGFLRAVAQRLLRMHMQKSPKRSFGWAVVQTAVGASWCDPPGQQAMLLLKMLQWRQGVNTVIMTRLRTKSLALRGKLWLVWLQLLNVMHASSSPRCAADSMHFCLTCWLC